MQLFDILLLNKAEQNAPEIVPLTFTNTSANDDATVTLKKTGSPVVNGIQYRLGTDGEWTPYTIGTSINVAVGESVQFQNINGSLSTGANDYVTFAFTRQFSASGSLRSMVNYSNELPDQAFLKLFYKAAQLRTAPLMDFVKVGEGACVNMFDGCNTLFVAPELPATEINKASYTSMFWNCTALTTPPSILPAETLYEECYANMFYNCTKLKSAPILPATTIPRYAYAYMFYYCESLAEAPELPAEILANECYKCMFSRCTSLTEAPELPAEALVSYCYYQMFSACSKLSKIKVGFKSWNSNNTYNWVNGVSSTGDFDAPADLPLIFGNSNIPTGWNVINAKPFIKAEDQGMAFSTIIEKSYKIKYEVFPIDYIVTFALAEGTTLPAGLELNSSTGEIKGISTASEGVYETKIKLSAPNCEDVIITFTITITSSASFTTPHNLTSNTSDTRYEVSQSTNHDPVSKHAWRAMDGLLLEGTGEAHTNRSSNQWWKIKFNEGPVFLDKVTWTNRTGGNGYLSNPYKIQGSNDDSTWTTVYTINDMVGDSEAVRSWDIGSSTKYQYWRILQEAYSYLIIGELEFEYSF